MLTTTSHSTFILTLIFSSFSFHNAYALNGEGPFAVFHAVHLEATANSSNYKYQEKYWPNLIGIIDIADLNNAKITLLLNPQWAEYILQDDSKYNLIKNWQANGHEIGLHYHLVTHNDWCGHTNRSEYKDDLLYRGTVEEMMQSLKALAAPYEIVSACCGIDIGSVSLPTSGRPVATRFIDDVDFPNEIIYDIDGFFQGLSKPLPFEFQGKKRYHLRHLLLKDSQSMLKVANNITEAQPDEILGIVTHGRDYDPTTLNQLFELCRETGVAILSVREIMESYLEIYPPQDALPGQ